MLDIVVKILTGLIVISISILILSILYKPKKVESGDGTLIMKEGSAKYLMLFPFVFFVIIGVVSYKSGGIFAMSTLLFVGLIFLFYFVYLTKHLLVYKDGKIYEISMFKKKQEYDVKDITKVIFYDGMKMIFKNGNKIKIEPTFENYNEFENIIKSLNVPKEVR